MGEQKKTFEISKKNDFSNWYSEILKKAELVDVRYGVKGFAVIRPWGAKIIEKMYRIYESALQRTGHEPSFFPTVIPESYFELESSHVKGFTPEVFWLESKKGEERLALRPTSETAMYKMYSLWVRSYRDLPLRMYQRANVFRLETKATRPLIRGREFLWIEAHDVFATRKEAEEQVKDDIKMTKSVMEEIFGVPFIPMRRPEWDKFPGAEYTIGSDSLMPDGKVIQQPSTHMLGQKFSKPFNIKFIDEAEKERFAFQTCYGVSMSRILSSIISVHGDDNGLRIPYVLSPVQAVIVPFISKGKEKGIMDFSRNLNQALFDSGVSSIVDDSNKSPGDKFYYWEMKGVPIRIEIGSREISSGNATVFVRDTRERVKVLLKNLAEEVKNLGAEYDSRLVSRARGDFNEKICDCLSKDDLRGSIESGKIARFNFCSRGLDGAGCAEYIEKELLSRVMGTREDANEKPKGKCIICSKDAGAVMYAARSY